jgi:hypothetical protein
MLAVIFGSAPLAIQQFKNYFIIFGGKKEKRE